MDWLKFDIGDYITPKNLLYGILAGSCVEYLFELYLNYRQNKVYRTAKEVPEPIKHTLDKETFEKARSYGKDRNIFSSFSDTYSIATLVALLLVDGLYVGWSWSRPMLDSLRIWPATWDLEIGQSMCFSLMAMMFNTIVGLPLSVYSTFVLEEKHGFNKQTVGFFVKDFFKKILVSAAIMTPLTGLIVTIIKAGGQLFFIYLWAFSFVVLMFFMTIYPVLIAPLFDKYTPLKEGPLRTRIENLAAKIKFPLTKLYVVEGSKRSAHSNAYLYGFFNNKRIVLFDTLIKGYVSESTDSQETSTTNDQSAEKKEKDAKEEKGCTDEEIEAVLGHELGHWKLSHVVKNIVISQVNIFFVFSFFAFLHKSSTLYEAFGFPRTSEKPVLIGLIVILQFILQIYNTAMSYGMNVLSRKFEYEADQFATELGYGNELKTALIKLNKDNLGFPVCDPLYSAWHHSHPTLLHRMAAIDEQMAKQR